MGYYAQSFEGIINIPAERQEVALAAVNLKFAEVNTKYPPYYQLPIYAELVDALNDQQFEFAYDDNGDYLVYNFDAKWRDQEHFLNALGMFVTETSEMAFRGEDGEMWKWTPQGVKSAQITWV